MSTLKKSHSRRHKPQYDHDELQHAIQWQQIQLLFWDVDNLLELYKQGIKKYNLAGEKANRLLDRVNQTMERLDEWAARVVLSEEELDRFANCRKTLDELAYDLSDYLK